MLAHARRRLSILAFAAALAMPVAALAQAPLPSDRPIDGVDQAAEASTPRRRPDLLHALRHGALHARRASRREERLHVSRVRL